MKPSSNNTSHASPRCAPREVTFFWGVAADDRLPLEIPKMPCRPRSLIYLCGNNTSHASPRCAPGRLLFSGVWRTPDGNFFSPNGAAHDSPGQRPGNRCIPFTNSPNGATNVSLGQRPRNPDPIHTRALKGRSKPCRNPSPAFTCIWFSAPRTANPSSPIPFVVRCMPTWPPFFKTSAAIRSLSIPSKITSTFSSNSLAPCPSVRPWKTSKNPRPNGSRNRDRNFGPSHGNRDTVPSPFPNPTSKSCGNTSPINANTIERRPFKMNTGRFSNGTMLHSMNDTSGINPRFGSPRWGSGIFSKQRPRALPWATVDCPFGARDESNRRGRAGIVHSDRRGRAGIVHSDRRGRAGIVHSDRRGRAGIVHSDRRGRAGIVHSNRRGRAGIVHSDRRGRAGTRALPFATVGCPFGAYDLCPKGANYDSPGQRPGNTAPHIFQALKGRPISSANGATYDSLGQRPGTPAPHISQALTGRTIR